MTYMTISGSAKKLKKEEQDEGQERKKLDRKAKKVIDFGGQDVVGVDSTFPFIFFNEVQRFTYCMYLPASGFRFR